MIEASAALTTLASAVAPPSPTSEATLRAPSADQPKSAADRSGGSNSIRYFRFNLRYDAVDQQLYFVFKNPVTGAVVDEAPSERSVRSSIVNRSSVVSERPSAPSGGQTAASSDGASSPPASPKSGAPATSGAPGAPGASSGELGRGSAVDSRI